MKDLYIFPAVFSNEKDGISVEFPDLPGCLTCGETVEEAVLMAKDALPLHLYGMEEDGERTPEPSKPGAIKLEPNQYLVMIEAWMPPYRERIANKAVKKTLTLPKWLNDLAERNQVNFSRVLQEGLIERLGVGKAGSAGGDPGRIAERPELYRTGRIKGKRK